MSKYLATVILKWEFKTDLDAYEVAEKRLDEILPDRDGILSQLIVEVATSKSKKALIEKERKPKAILGEFAPDEVLPYVSNDDAKRKYLGVDGLLHEVRMNSHRYFIFKSSPCCAACGLTGTKMLLEQHPNDKNPHFNFYALEDNGLVLMTKDHIRAKSFGGEDRHSNYQTMCAVCNNLKGNDNLTLADIFRLRTIFNDNKKSLTKKKLNELINNERQKLKIRDWDCFVQERGLIVKADLAIVKQNGKYSGMSIYEASERAKSAIACIRKGTVIDPVAIDELQCWIPFNNHRCSIYHGYIERI
jgi:5-methylcytosine-specific restriction endonuclease McrA